MIVVDNAAVGADGNIHARLAEILVARGAHVDQRRRLSAADALRLTRDADRAAANADLHKVRAALGEEAEAVAVDNIARADLHRIAVALTHKVDDALLPDGIALGRVDAEHVCTRLDQRRDALGVVAGVDARADQIALLRILKRQRVLLMLVIVLAENEIEQPPRIVHDRQRIELMIPDDVVGFLERGGGRCGDELLARRHEIAHLDARIHAADAVVAAGHDAEQLPVRRGVLGDGDGGIAILILQRQHIRQHMLRRQIRGADDKARLAVLDAADHLGLALNGLRAVDERQAALLCQRDGQRIV